MYIPPSLLVLSTVFGHVSQAGHLHRHLRYRQLDDVAQQVVDPAAELSSDITKIQQSVASLGTGMTDYFGWLSDRLSRMEKMLGVSSHSSAAIASAVAVQTLTTSAADGSATTITTSTCLSSAAITTSLPASSVAASSATSAGAPNVVLSTGAPSSLSSSTFATYTSASAGQKQATALSSPSTAATPSASSSGNSVSSSSSSSGGNTLAVYYGSSPSTSAQSLTQLCADPSISILILSFIPTFFTPPSNLPTASFGPLCSPATQKTSSNAPGLPSCAALASQVQQCQASGKKVLASLGGYIAQSSFTSDEQATQFAQTLWSLFGRDDGRNETLTALRPLGNVVLDGFDIDNEDHSTAHWAAFGSALRALYASDPSRKYLLTAAPQCPRPDASIPADLYQHADYVSVQFYNNPSCNADAGQGFVESVAAWSADLASAGASAPKLLVGLGAWPGAGSGFVQASQLPQLVAQAKQAASATFGGVMLWDGTNGEADGYVQAVHSALEGAR